MRNQSYDLLSSNLTSDELHNRNCYRYLMSLSVFPAELSDFAWAKECSEIHEYDPKIAYGTLYSTFMEKLEDYVIKGGLTHSTCDEFIISLYENDNKNLLETYAVIKDITLRKTASSPLVGKQVAHKMQDTDVTLNGNTPAQAGSMQGRFMDMITPYFKPSHKTSLATIRCYDYNRNDQSNRELRFGTQAQTHHYFSRVSPLFKRFLQAQKNIPTVRRLQKKITHVYFNNLAKDRSALSYEGRFEMSLTSALHDLEHTADNIAVITLPADKGLMSHHPIEDTALVYDKAAVRQIFLAIAQEDSSAQESIRDFHISPKIRKALFGDKEKTILTQLLDNSFDTMGLTDSDKLSEAQRQAVWVHFIKFELPQYIIQKLNPETYNFSCKDAIDRGGVASAYYNLLRSFKTEKPMSREEFEQALHAAPVMVKGRGMNDHLNIIWNALDQYLSVERNPPLKPETQQWLTEWRDANCPKERAGELLRRRLEVCVSDLESKELSDVITSGIALLKSVKDCDLNYAENQPLYLDVVVSTYAFCLDPNLVNDHIKSQQYAELIEKMKQCDSRPISFMEAFFRILKRLFFFSDEGKQDSNHQDVSSKMSGFPKR